tara:strand:+ start:198 stop:449 length:252 start_codon:yes stop_codon:yes gene_type:complete
MSYKARFNRFYRQDVKQSNSFQEISDLTGIGINKIERRYNEIIKYPYTYGFYDLDKPLKVEQFARVGVYKYALDHKLKGPVLK